MSNNKDIETNTKEKEYRACNTSAECTERW